VTESQSEIVPEWLRFLFLLGILKIIFFKRSRAKLLKFWDWEKDWSQNY